MGKIEDADINPRKATLGLLWLFIIGLIVVFAALASKDEDTPAPEPSSTHAPSTFVPKYYTPPQDAGDGFVDFSQSMALPNCGETPGGAGPCAIIADGTDGVKHWWYVPASWTFPEGAQDLGVWDGGE